jgi:hypothetical protein
MDPRWSTFLKAYWECLAASDLLSVEVCIMRALVTQYVLFFINIASQSVHVAGITPGNSWMTRSRATSSTRTMASFAAQVSDYRPRFEILGRIL